MKKIFYFVLLCSFLTTSCAGAYAAPDPPQKDVVVTQECCNTPDIIMISYDCCKDMDFQVSTYSYLPGGQEASYHWSTELNIVPAAPVPPNPVGSLQLSKQTEGCCNSPGLEANYTNDPDPGDNLAPSVARATSPPTGERSGSNISVLIYRYHTPYVLRC